MSTVTQILDQKQADAFRQILIATDFSEASRRALDYALAIARRYGSTLSVVNAIPPEPRDKIPLEALPRELNRPWLEAEQEMETLGKQDRLKDVKHHLLLRQGQVWDVLASVIQSEDVDLLVLGTRGRGGLKKLALGSVAEQVLRLASCPVLTIGPHVPPPVPGAPMFSSILFATDFGPAAYGPASYGAQEYIEWQRTTREQSHKGLRELLPSNAQLAATPEYIVGTNFLPEGILETAASHNIELI